MKYIFSIFLLLYSICSFSQSGNYQIKIGYQLLSTPYIGTKGEGYHGQFEYFFRDRFSISLGLGQVVGQEITTRGSRVNLNGINSDNSYILTSREGVNYIEMNLLYRPFKLSKRNHFKIGIGAGMESVWVEYPETASVVSGVIQEVNYARHIHNFTSTSILLENDFYLTPEISFNAKIIGRIPSKDVGIPVFERRITYSNGVFGSGASYSDSSLNATVALIMGVGYRF